MSPEAQMLDATKQLASFAASLDYDALPAAVVTRTEELFLDWLGAALGGVGQHPIPAFERFVTRMGPATGPAEMVGPRRCTSPSTTPQSL